MFERIKENYIRNWITEEQLERYVALKAITKIQANDIRELKHNDTHDGR